MSAVPERCALPGCDEPIEQPADGGPRRKFCTAAHRAAARRLRHEQRDTVDIPVQPDPSPAPTPRARLAVADRPPRSHDEAPEAERRRQFVADSHAANAERRRRAQRAVGTRRRGIAVLGAASILAAGGGWVVIDKSRVAAPDTAPVATSDVASGTAEWATRAQQALASVDAQLDLVNQVQAAWNALPESRSGVLPQPVVELLAHKARLEQQRAMLESQLSALKSLDTSRAALASTERQLASVERALQAIPASGPSPEQADNARQLTAQRDLLTQQRTNQQREVQAWDDSVRNSVAKPLPELEKVTGPVTDDVIALIDNSDRPSSPPPAVRVSSPLPPATNRQDWAQRERQDVNTGAPPNPGNPSWEALGQPSNAKPSTQPVGQTVDPETVDAITRAVSPAEDSTAPSPAPRAVTKVERADPSSQDTAAAMLRQLTADQDPEQPGVQNPYFSDFDPTTPGVQNPALDVIRAAQDPPPERTPTTTSSSQPRPTKPTTTPRAAATPKAPAKPTKTPTTKPTAPANGAAVAPQAKPSPKPPTPKTRSTSGPATTPTATTTSTELAPTKPSPAATADPTTAATPPPATPSPSATPTRTPEPVAT